ncbi:Na+/H+ antiporter NhaA [Nakamurella sp. A5-74]|uniref:Na(+)/H(+) antiporter NhaA n=1 Tax=Nakamurella sp. A5-74 TaxID=3158264 RepID=A0AAU8DU94_9ACTN
MQERSGFTLFDRGSWPEAGRIATLLRSETVGGVLLLLGAVIALVWINSPLAASYAALRDTVIGPSALHLDLSLGTWAADGLLALFFFVAGLELKREFVAGDLRTVRRALTPVAAAIGGMLLPIATYLVVNAVLPGGRPQGWAIATATDIAFALAVLAVVGRQLPTALRTFLLTLAVVDDLLAITIIAVFFTAELHLAYLAMAMLPIAAFGVLVQRRVRSWYLLIPLAVTAWALVHASGVHATVAGVLLAFTVPVLRSEAAGGPDAGPGLAEHFEHRLRPLSAGLAVPVFAFFAAGVPIGGAEQLGRTLSDPIAIGVVLGLVLGKPIGIMLTTYLVGKLTRSRLPGYLSWWDVLGMSMLGGIGFTVSLLIGELAFVGDPVAGEAVKTAVLVGTVLSALVASVVLFRRSRRYRLLAEQEQRDDDGDGIPDVYQQRS